MRHQAVDGSKEGHAVERAPGLLTASAASRPLFRASGVERDDGVEGRIVALDAGELGVKRVGGREATYTNGFAGRQDYAGRPDSLTAGR